MAKDRWGSLVLAGALSHVDDTVLLRKCILPELQVPCSSCASNFFSRFEEIDEAVRMSEAGTNFEQ